jgi:hypothetical protein
MLEEEEGFYVKLVQLQHRAIRTYRIAMIAYGVSGLLVIIFALAWPWKPDENILKTSLSIGGALISAAALYPFDKVRDRKEKIMIYEDELEKIKNTRQQKKGSEARIKAIKELVGIIKEKIATR